MVDLAGNFVWNTRERHHVAGSGGLPVAFNRPCRSGSPSLQRQRTTYSYQLLARLLLWQFLGPDGDPTNPFVSPLYADLTGLPPLLVMVGTAEILLDDSIRLAAKARLQESLWTS